MIRLFVLSVVVVGMQANAQPHHPCSGDALARAGNLLHFHWHQVDLPHIDLDGTAHAIAPIRALQGPGQFDVLETWGYVYRARYRMRFIYARIPGHCVLMGQEIIEDSDPY